MLGGGEVYRLPSPRCAEGNSNERVIAPFDQSRRASHCGASRLGPLKRTSARPYKYGHIDSWFPPVICSTRLRKDFRLYRNGRCKGKRRLQPTSLLTLS